ncbi:hypothetical protein OUZ56_007440 [Daphnia magna]|uniref:Uncharacterized protein n=1 Tax=Daphnia magna TaxID=35525 RepID=A0ABR0AA58_9CRUS|nr:hypothetical protein OUZ56_007440 [Daphnia magna]
MFWTYSKRSPGPGCAGDSEPSIVQSDCTSDVSTSALQRRLDENHEKRKERRCVEKTLEEGTFQREETTYELTQLHDATTAGIASER